MDQYTAVPYIVKLGAGKQLLCIAGNSYWNGEYIRGNLLVFIEIIQSIFLDDVLSNQQSDAG